MAKQMKKTRLPDTDSIEELARFWDTHDATDFDDEFEEVTEAVFVRKPVATSNTVIAPKSKGRTKSKPKRVPARNFSERYGYKPIRQALQLESMDDDLRNSLWNTFVNLYLSSGELLLREFEGSYERKILRSIWEEFFKFPQNDLKDHFSSERGLVRERYFRLKWNEVYDLLEFLVEKGGKNGEVYTSAWNRVLEREGAGYRFVGGYITPITAEAEIAAIEEAAGTPYRNVNEHIRRAVALMSDRKRPDFRNAIKESISAVEALVRSLTGQPKATLGQALRVLEKERDLHPALKSAFSSLYGYTSDESGIRHALLEESNLAFNEAKFMLVSCSAFVNFVIAESSHREAS